jgi:hypothetical protein
MMSDQIILTVPDDIADRARQISESTVLSVERVLLDHLKTLTISAPILPAEAQAELDALIYLSTDALLTIAQEQMPDEAQTRAQELLRRNSQHLLSEVEIAELEQLIERGDRLMLRKAEAAAILQKRRKLAATS